MQLAIYRSLTHATYPDESLAYSYALHPIAAVDMARDGHLMCWIDDSGNEPYAVIEVPDDSQIAEQEHGWQLLVPDRQSGIDAEEVFELAREQFFGLSVIRGPRDEKRHHFW
jgi:hypothetical protein